MFSLAEQCHTYEYFIWLKDENNLLPSIPAIVISNARAWLINVRLSFLAWLSSATLMIFFLNETTLKMKTNLKKRKKENLVYSSSRLRRQPQNEDELKNEDDLKNEDGIKKMKTISKMKTT